MTGKLYALIGGVPVLIGNMDEEVFIEVAEHRVPIVRQKLEDAHVTLGGWISEEAIRVIVREVYDAVVKVSYPYNATGKPRRRGKGERKKNRQNRW